MSFQLRNTQHTLPIVAALFLSVGCSSTKDQPADGGASELDGATAPVDDARVQAPNTPDSGPVALPKCETEDRADERFPKCTAANSQDRFGTPVCFRDRMVTVSDCKVPLQATYYCFPDGQRAELGVARCPEDKKMCPPKEGICSTPGQKCCIPFANHMGSEFTCNGLGWDQPARDSERVMCTYTPPNP